MGETTDLIGVYGAVDEAVAHDSDRRAAVARVLPVYETDVRWFDDFAEWTHERLEDPTEGEPFPTLAEALDDLGANEHPRRRERARRLHAIAVAARAFPEIVTPGTELNESARNALAVRGLANETESAQRLLEIIGTDDIEPLAAMTPDEWWESVLHAAAEEGLISGDVADLGPRPCTGRLVDVPGGDAAAATLRSEFETRKIDFDSAVAFLEPSNWPNCCDFWCEMTRVGQPAPHVRSYHEVVSVDCASKASTWTISAELDFAFVKGTDFAITEYQLSDGHPMHGDDVQVDEGSLVVEKLRTGGIRVTTTKRIRFNRAFSGEALAMIMCALGYDSVVEHLVFTCAPHGSDSGTPFPIVEPVSAPKGPSASGEAGAPVANCIEYMASLYSRTPRKAR